MEYADWIKEKPLNQLVRGDCMDGMREFPDNYFDLAIVDPPYGIGEDGGRARTRGSKRTNGLKKSWDSNIPNFEYFEQLERITKDRIIWGANYFVGVYPLQSRGWIYWRKKMGGDFADGELAYTSFDRVLKEFDKRSETFGRIHPTQKPIALYKWILLNYAKPDFKILDTHVGSASSIIAFLDFGCEYLGFEIDHDYYKAASERIRIHKMQTKLF